MKTKKLPRIAVYLPAETHKAFKVLCVGAEVTMQDWLEDRIVEALVADGWEPEEEVEDAD